MLLSGKLAPGAELGMTVEVDAVSKLSHPVYDYVTLLRERKAKNNYKSKPRCYALTVGFEIIAASVFFRKFKYQMHLERAI